METHRRCRPQGTQDLLTLVPLFVSETSKECLQGLARNSQHLGELGLGSMALRLVALPPELD
eukprot:CAMPEP_0197676546 /NCGR_PEP_ID=MMETSP1338-20131121/86992_1 /TAXON_ID=43686 ORGANISM="Pelagodinium beii, Strain RCC1491" /NCGR_SAMPLE_ID=MMETSP1338 /ASSEMBLY_ACC=CAM_ASM_000754 /LENGTH=61 /DNA_ID=CAMNT_0043257241 /DNA_START=60 /DNA_END=242 /DNA_ORIENTATION=+